MKVKSPLSGKPSTTTPSSEFDTANKKYVDDNLLSHIDNLAIHLTSAQNSWLDAITATAAEVNHLSGVTSDIQTQLTNGLSRANHTGEQAISTITNLQTQLNYGRGLNEGTPDLDPNTTASNVIITNHANSPVASGYYWHITTTFYTSITGTANRGQLAIQYNGGISAYVRSCFGGVWTAWTRIDNAGGGTMTAMIRTFNSFGTAVSLTTNIGSTSLQVMGDATTAAFMSFHRSGTYALNLGIDTDNVFKLGGWSAPNVTTFSCTPAGNFQPRLSLSLPSEYVIGNITGAATINFGNGQKARATLTGNVTLTFNFPGVGHYTLVLVQDATGNRTVSYAVAPRFVGRATAPDINVTANSETILTVYWNGANAYLTGSKVGAA